MACQVVRQLLQLSIFQNYLRRHGIFWMFISHIRTLGYPSSRNMTYYERHTNTLKIAVLDQHLHLVKMLSYGPLSHMLSSSIEQ